MPKFNKPDSPNIIWGVNAVDGGLTRPSDVKIQAGWMQEKPPYEFENYSMNRLYQGFAYYNQIGIPEWDSATEYQANKSYIQGSNGRLYKCTQTNINKNPATAGNESFWDMTRVTDTEIKNLFNASNNPPVYACRAWSNFNGKTLNVRGSGNIQSITRIEPSKYLVTFSIPMPDSNYSVCVSAAQDRLSGPLAAADGVSWYNPTSSSFVISTFNNVSDSLSDTELELISFSVFR